MWRHQKKASTKVTYVTGESLKDAVSVATQWVCWVQDGRPRGRVKFNRWKVESPHRDGGWYTMDEGTLEDAQTQQHAQDSAATQVSTSAAVQALARQRIGVQGATRRTRGRQSDSRLAALVAQVKAKK